MKKNMLLMVVIAVGALLSCQKGGDGGTTSASVVNVKINVDKMFTRSIETGHPGNNDETVSPKIYSVSLLVYNEYGAEMSRVDLSDDQLKEAIWGKYRNPDGTPGSNTTEPAGASVGIPSGAYSVDVVLNLPTSLGFESGENINLFNYRDNTNGKDEPFKFGEDNFDRVFLATDQYETKGQKLKDLSLVAGDIPTYTAKFTVRPSLSRFEVYGGINVAKAENWVDGWNNLWKTKTVAEYELETGDTPDVNGHYTKGAVKGTVANGFDQNLVYMSQYYWFANTPIVPEKQPRTGANSYETEADVPANGFGWVKHPIYATTPDSEIVKWYPNSFYAVDVEEIFINNIKVRSTVHDHFMLPWPGEGETTKYWPNWYKAFHLFHWHTAGTSSTNTFLCMGNMWDRIADSGSTVEITIPQTEDGHTKMPVLTGKATPKANKSNYYDTNRNLGIATGRAAAYMIYPQKKQDKTAVTDKETLKQELPHIVLKVKAYEDAAKYQAGTYLTNKQFITVSLFSNGKDGAVDYVTSFVQGNIYRFNLNDLLYLFVGNVPVPEGKMPDGVVPTDPVDPDPEMPGAQVTMKVQVLPWNIKNIYPII